jgi:leader peptidase (prepilin peptidase)/N-methyltransferase
LRGRCRHCGSKISLRYPLIELASGILFLSAALNFTGDAEAIVSSFFFFVLLIISIIDFEHMIIPDRISLSFAATSLAVSGVGSLAGKPILPLTGKPGFTDSIVGSFLITAAFVLIEILSRNIFKKEGIGMGDVKLGISIGIYLGPYSLLALFLAYLIGAPLGLYLKYRMKSEYIPFGPFLAMASVLTVFFGERILSWYFSLGGI